MNCISAILFFFLCSFSSFVVCQRRLEELTVVYSLTMKGLSKTQVDGSAVLQRALRVALSTVLNLSLSSIGQPTAAVKQTADSEVSVRVHFITQFLV